ncbi:zinc-ribbon domain-containing protein [Candidatus Poseidoniaceae archaeon]|nr:zinc-ribbon domain-containing protein [Candidatus Poseidoniaceae archaeon]
MREFPEVLAQWDIDKNESDINPHDIAAGSSKKFHWVCSKGSDHNWIAPVGRRTLGIGCPFCANQQVSVTNSLATKYPELSKQWHPTKNGSLLPHDVISGSKRKVWWKCEVADDHEWEGPLTDRVSNSQKYEKGGECPFCKGKRVCESNSLAFEFPDLICEWDYQKNITGPESYTSGSNKKVHWICSFNPEHKWVTNIVHRTRSETGCPYCGGQKVDSSYNLETEFPEIALEWHTELNSPLKPTDYTPFSNINVWWKCPKGEDHVFDCTIVNRTRENVKCPVCYGRRAVESNCLETTHPKLAAEWHPSRNSLTPKEVTKGSNKLVWWKCKNHEHEWRTAPNSRDLPGCPLCPKKNQTALFEIVKKLYPDDEILFDYKHPELIFPSGWRMELDIWLPRIQLALEYQGQQHYDSSYWHESTDRFESQQKRDEEKRIECGKIGITLVEIPYWWEKSIEYVQSRISESIN